MRHPTTTTTTTEPVPICDEEAAILRRFTARASTAAVGDPQPNGAFFAFIMF